MRMTKIVKDYITDEITAKYQPHIDAAEAEYNGDAEAVNQAVIDVRARMEDVVKQAYRKALAPFYDEENLSRVLQRDVVGSPYIWQAASKKAIKRNDVVGKLTAARDKAIKDVLITMELGGTKADLDRMLAEIAPEV